MQRWKVVQAEGDSSIYVNAIVGKEEITLGATK